MDPLRLHKGIIMLISACICLAGCRAEVKQYSGSIDLKGYPWLRGSRIFIDPGHGDSRGKDLFRIGPGGTTEDSVNLRVGLILAGMLKKAGATVTMSRHNHRDIPLELRVKKAREFKPDLLVSIHHNGTARRMDGVNYPSILIWGNPGNNRASHDFARLLLEEFHKIMDERGTIVSDFAVFPETGTRILRETRYICPGLIGEAGFFSDETHSLRLRDHHYNQREAEAYFTAIAEYIHRGLPRAQVIISVPADNTGYLKNLISESRPHIVINAESGADGVGIDKKSFMATLNGIPVTVKAITDTSFAVNYGPVIYPGGNRLVFSFKNQRQQHSMICSIYFNRKVSKGDYDTLVRQGLIKVKSRRTAGTGIKMLRGALSMGSTGPDADRLIWHIAWGYRLLGDHDNSAFYFAKLRYFYPESVFTRRIPLRMSENRHPVDYLGKELPLKYDPGMVIKPAGESSR